MRYIKFTAFIILFMMTGCVSMETVPQHVVTDDVIRKPRPTGIYHKVRKRETLWRIAKTYDVDIKDIIDCNNIPNIAKLEVNQLILIPGAKQVREVYLGQNDLFDDFVWPLKGKILRYFNSKQDGTVSRGIDIKANRGDLVRASREGKVVFADYLPGQGYMIILDHADDFYTVYSKNAKLLVKHDAYVHKNDPIAHVGQIGRLSYLHFQIRKNNREDNPLFYLP